MCNNTTQLTKDNRVTKLTYRQINTTPNNKMVIYNKIRISKILTR